MAQNRPYPGSAALGPAGPKLTLVHLVTELERGQAIDAGSGREIDAAASRWFVRFHCDPLDAFDWAAFEGWIQEQPAHRRAYERIEQIWYNSRPEGDPADRPEVSAAALADPSGSGRVVRLRVPPHAPDQRSVRAGPILGQGAETEALIEGDVPRCGGFEPGGPPDPVQSLRPGL